MIVKNSAFLLLGEAVNRGGKMLGFYVVALLLQKTMFGAYSFLISLSVPVMVALDFGLNSVIVYRTSPSRYRRLMPFFLLLKTMVVALVCLGLTGLQSLFHLIPVAAPEFAAFLFLCLGYDLQIFMSNSLRTGLDFSGDFWLKLLSNCLFLVALILVLAFHSRLSVTIALWLQAAAFLLSAAWALPRLLAMLPRRVPLRRHRSKGLKAVARISAPMAIAGSAGLLQPSIDSLVLGSTRHFETNASFTLVNRLNQFAQLPVNILIFSGLPYLVEHLGGVRKTIDRKTLWAVVSLLIVVGAIASQAFVLVIEWLIPWMLGRQYSDTVSYAAVLSLYVVPLYVYSLLLNLLCIVRQVVATQLIMAAGTLLGLGLDIWVIRTAPASQIMWVTVAGQWFLLGLFTAYYRIKLREWPFGPVQLCLIGLSTLALLVPWLSFGEANWRESLVRCVILTATISAGAVLALRHKPLILGLLRAGSRRPARS